MKILEKDGKFIYYHIVKKQIKHTYFRLKKDHVLITTNKHVKEAQIVSLLKQKFDVLHHRLNKTVKLEDHQIRLWQKTYHLILKPGRFDYHISDCEVICNTSIDDINQTRKMIYKQEMKNMMNLLKDKIKQTLDYVGLDECPYKYKYLKSKFGSYHKKHHEITLNTFLATIDPIFLEYVIYHEYAHHKVFNHSKGFYDVLDQMMPNHKNIQKTLKKMEII